MSLSDKERRDMARRTLRTLGGMYDAILAAGGSPTPILTRFGDRPLVEFIEQVMIPNGLRLAVDRPEAEVPRPSREQLSVDELRSRLSTGPSPRSIWRHYKGLRYVACGNVIEESTGGVLVTYCPEGNPLLMFARPLREWHERVDGQLTRYTLCREAPHSASSLT